MCASIDGDADALITRTRTKCNAKLLEGSRVRLIATATIGYDHIDIEYCQSHNIEVVTSAGCNSRGVLQWVGGALSHLASQQGWHPAEQTLGVVGVGNIGRLIAEYGTAWGFRVVCCDPPRQRVEGGDFVELTELLKVADIITLHTPLTKCGCDPTLHLADDTFFEQMRPNSIFLNTSRGAVADNQAVARAIDRGLTVGLDVWEGEPQIDLALLHRCAISTPHIAGYSAQGKATATAMVVSAVARNFDLPLQGFFPSSSTPSKPRPIDWGELQNSICNYFDIAEESSALKTCPHLCGQMRDSYWYRGEFFKGISTFRGDKYFWL